MKGEGQQVERDEQSREVLLSVPETVLKVVASGFQNVGRLILDLPACAATGGEFGDVFVATGRSVMKLFRQVTLPAASTISTSSQLTASASLVSRNGTPVIQRYRWVIQAPRV